MAKKIMIVDDALETLALIEAILQGQGYATIPSSSAKEALGKLRSERPDLILLDVLMPEMDGFALFKELKKERPASTIPILVLTVRTRMEDTFRALGADEFLAKPFDAQLLLDKVRSIFGEGPAAAVSIPGEEESRLEHNADAQTVTATLVSAEPQKQATPVAVKRVMIVSTSEYVVSGIKNTLDPFNPILDLVVRENKAVSQVLNFKPDIIVMDVFFNDRSAAELVTKFRQLPQVAKNPIILFSFLDKENEGGGSIHQKVLAIDAARTACMKAGASEAIGGFEATRFLQVIKKYL